jgi:hypothetical protein
MNKKESMWLESILVTVVNFFVTIVNSYKVAILTVSGSQAICATL